jgi:hypothetical protein
MFALVDWLTKAKKKPLCCVDTCFILGSVLKSIEKGKWKINIKEDKRFKELLNASIIFLITELNVYEIKRVLVRNYSISIDSSHNILASILNKEKNIVYISMKEIKIEPSLIN